MVAAASVAIGVAAGALVTSIDIAGWFGVAIAGPETISGALAIGELVDG